MTDTQTILAALAFGVVYALIVYIPLHGKHSGYTSLLVVVGVMVSLAISIAEIGLDHTLRVLMVFACTGGPMILGEAIRTKYDETKQKNKGE